METLEDFRVFSYAFQRNIQVNFDNTKILADACEFQGGGMNLLGWKPFLGRILTKEDSEPGAAPVVVLSYFFGKTSSTPTRILSEILSS